MRDLFDYINAAMRNSHAKSERKLCEMLGLPPAAITHYRRGVLPSEKTMVKLARLAGVPPWEALIDLGMWRAENDSVKDAYKTLRERVIKSILALVFAAFLVSPAAQAASPQPLTTAQKGGENAAYVKRYYILRKIRLYDILRRSLLRCINGLCANIRGLHRSRAV